MENREHVLDDYFKLRVMLNRTNLIRDQKTEIEFIVLNLAKGYSLVATLQGVKDPKHIELCTTDGRGIWMSSGYSGLFDLEEFCSAFIRRNLNRKFSLEDAKMVVTSLKKELKDLGIPR